MKKKPAVRLDLISLKRLLEYLRLSESGAVIKVPVVLNILGGVVLRQIRSLALRKYHTSRDDLLYVVPLSDCLELLLQEHAMKTDTVVHCYRWWGRRRRSAAPPTWSTLMD